MRLISYCLFVCPSGVNLFSPIPSHPIPQLPFSFPAYRTWRSRLLFSALPCMTHFHFPYYTLSSDSIAKHTKEKKGEKRREKNKTQPMNQNRCMIIQEGKSNRNARDFASLIRPIIWTDTDADADTITTTTATSSSDDDDVLYRDRLRALRPLVEVIIDTLPPRLAN